MDTIKQVLLENPLPIWILLGLAELVILILWARRRRAKLGWSALGVAAAAAAVTVLAHFVETDRERIAAALDRIARDVEAGHFEAAREILDDQCVGVTPGGRPLTKDDLLTRGREGTSAWPITEIVVHPVVTTVDGDTAVTNATTYVHIEAAELLGQPLPIVWKLHWRRTPAAWRIIQVEILQPKELRNLRL